MPATRSIWKLVTLLSFGMFFELYDLLFTAYVAPALVASGILKPVTPRLFGGNGVAGFIAALFFATLICGFLADKYGRRAIFTYSLLWYSTATVVMAFQKTAFGLNVWRFIAALGIGVEIVTIGTYLTELTPKHIRGRAFARSQTVGFSAVPVAAFLSYLLVPRTLLALDGWRWVVLLGAHGAIFVWWIGRHLPESTRWLAQRGRVTEADRIAREIEARVQVESGRTLMALKERAKLLPDRAGFGDMWVYPYRNRTIMLTVFHIFQTITHWSMGRVPRAS